MAQHGWTDAPHDVRAQVERLIVLMRAHVGDDLVAVYLHGSLAMGCFNPDRSDINLLAVAESPMSLSTKWRVAQVLLRLSGAPSPIEISFLQRGQLTLWSHPTPFDFCFGESHHGQYDEDLRSGAWKDWNREIQRDEALAGHVKVTRCRGVCLWGARIEDTLPEVPVGDYVASILASLARAGATVDSRLLNLARAWAYLETGAVMSKDEGGVWALGPIPARHAPAVEAALRLYRGDADASISDDEPTLEAVEYLQRQVAQLAGVHAGGGGCGGGGA